MLSFRDFWHHAYRLIPGVGWGVTAPWLIVVPDFDGGQQQELDEQGDEDQVRYQAPMRRPPRTGSGVEPSVIVMRKGLLCPSTAKLLSRLKRANATSMVSSDTARERLPAILMSVP